MKRVYLLAAAAPIILFGPQHLYAQDSGRRSVHVVAEQEVINRDALQEFGACTGPIMALFKAKVLVCGGDTNIVEGDPPKRFVILQFGNVAVAQSWLNLGAHKACEPTKKDAIRERVYLVEGLVQKL